ncbi:hypothetical protein F5876DRAFT_78481 [Lentinula aff. lateritia]|uniref:Uncharacterized protein n=1 Tax=Lentinula aff. lateritia TaxID=2804960 RepID=A0ACC1TVP0_9AGAR|nr:hypothetical protein F5876DRAFT_78481 [Lentinula aff. lateritia]
MNDFDSTVGALEIGNMVATYLFGIITLQTYFFFRTFPNDKPQVKAAVAAVFGFELGHTVTSLHALYIVTVTDFGQPQLITKLPDSINVTLLFEGMITIVVQGFFITRVQRLSKVHKMIIRFFWICAVLRFAASVALTIFGIQTDSTTTYVADWSWLLTTLFALGAFVDLGVALALCVYLYSQRSTSIARSNNNSLGSSDCVHIDNWSFDEHNFCGYRALRELPAQLLIMIWCSFRYNAQYVTMPDNSVWILMYTLLAKSYSNSMMVSLNSRSAVNASSGSNVITLDISRSANEGVHSTDRRSNFQSSHTESNENPQNLTYPKLSSHNTDSTLEMDSFNSMNPFAWATSDAVEVPMNCNTTDSILESPSTLPLDSEHDGEGVADTGFCVIA